MAKATTSSTSAPEKATKGESVGGALVSPQKEHGVAVGSPSEFTAYELKPLSFTFTMPPPEDYFFVRKDQIDGLMSASKDHYFDIGLRRRRRRAIAEFGCFYF
jgi:hypothetical protein